MGRDPGAASAPSLNTGVLLACQVVGIASVVCIQFVGSLVGKGGVVDPRLATLPVAVLVLSSALGTWPASQLMRRFGRKPCFIAAALLCAGCMVLAARAVVRADFWGFCAAVLGVGLQGAFVQQYRFARAFLLIIESAMIYSTAVLIEIILYFPGNNAFYIVYDPIAQLTVSQTAIHTPSSEIPALSFSRGRASYRRLSSSSPPSASRTAKTTWRARQQRPTSPRSSSATTTPERRVRGCRP